MTPLKEGCSWDTVLGFRPISHFCHLNLPPPFTKKSIDLLLLCNRSYKNWNYFLNASKVNNVGKKSGMTNKIKKIYCFKTILFLERIHLVLSSLLLFYQKICWITLFFYKHEVNFSPSSLMHDSLVPNDLPIVLSIYSSR